MKPPDQRFDNPDSVPEERIQDWTELFAIFQEREELQPHHNIEVQGLLAQEDMQESGEMIFYYSEIGSFWLTYDQESYQEGVAATGVLETRKELAELTGLDTMTPESNIKNMRKIYGGHNYLNPEQKAFNFFAQERLHCSIEVPRDFDRQKVISTIETGEHILDWQKQGFCSGEANPSELFEQIGPE